MATSVVLVVWNQLPLTRACLESLSADPTPFDLCVIDNGSTDGTRAWFEEFPLPYALTYHRNDVNVGLIRALNQGAALAKGDVLCFLHNDTEMRDPRWLDRLLSAVTSPTRIGLAGLYGVRRLRRDGRYVGRTIVHALEGESGLARRRDGGRGGRRCLPVPPAVDARVGGGLRRGLRLPARV